MRAKVSRKDETIVIGADIIQLSGKPQSKTRRMREAIERARQLAANKLVGF